MGNTLLNTGDVPLDALIARRNNLEPLGYLAAKPLWAGCIDAPDFIPAGSSLSDAQRYVERPNVG